MDYAERDYEIQKAGYAQAQGGSTLGGGAKQQAELLRVNDRIERLTQEVREHASRLHEHADRLKGDRPPSPTSLNTASPVRCGLLGSIEDGLDSLSAALSNLAEGVDRNTTLA